MSRIILLKGNIHPLPKLGALQLSEWNFFQNIEQSGKNSNI